MSACMDACTLYYWCLGKQDKGVIALRVIVADSRALPFGYVNGAHKLT